MSNVRIYLTEKKDGSKALVKATNQAQGLRHIARNEFSIKVASALDVAECMAAGMAVEDATKEPTDLIEESQP